MDAQLGVLADRYLLESPIARGGMATVWKARDQVLARTVAVKILHEHLADDEAFLARFRREALAAARLSHPNIVAIYDTGEEGEGGEDVRHFIVMELCSGGTLADLVDREGPFDAERLCWIGTNICDALAYAHDNEVIHRDIKPANVLLTEDGALKVGDFGIAKAAAATGDITTTGSILGTVTYVSPEQARGEEPDARSDIYSLGVLLYQCLVDRPPFKAETDVATALKHIHEKPPAPRSIKAGIPRPIEAVVLKALEKNPDDRFQSAHDMRAALERATGHAGSTMVMRQPAAARSAPVPGVAPGGREMRGLVPVMILVALGVALVLFGPKLADQVTDGNNGGPGNNGSSGGSAIEVTEVQDFDPHGDEEHADEVGLAIDGDPETAWETEDYSSPLSTQKPGVGLWFDLGESTEVSAIQVSTQHPGLSFEVRAADEVGEDEEGFELIETIDNADDRNPIVVDQVSARYWLVWITDLPGDGGGSGSIAEVRFLGS